MSSKEVVLFQNPKSILVVTQKGQMRQLFTPFRVICIEALDQIPLDCIVFVDAVFLHREHRLLYWVNNSRLVPYHHFAFQINW
jgi:hypothetical protein